jgi:hypothetical protein
MRGFSQYMRGFHKDVTNEARNPTSPYSLSF